MEERMRWGGASARTLSCSLPARPLLFAILAGVALGPACGDLPVPRDLDALTGGAPIRWTDRSCEEDADCETVLAVDSVCRQVFCDATIKRCRIELLPDGSDCDDGDLCSFGDHCLEGACSAGEPFGLREVEGSHCLRERCDSATGEILLEHHAPLCRVRFGPGGACWAWGCIDDCDPATGGCDEGLCAPVLRGNGESCNDGNECTRDDRCEEGSCRGTPVCQCETDLDCASWADPCLGSFHCVDYECLPVGDEVDCSGLAPPDCRERICNSPKGECIEPLLPPNSPCGPGGAGRCTTNGVCLDAGGCGCRNDADCALLEDGNACTGSLRCTLGERGLRCCLVDPATVPACPPPEARGGCERWTCEPSSGACEIAAPAEPGSVCDDGDPCTEDERCDAEGRCAGEPVVCEDDDNPCTAPVCESETGACALRPEPRNGLSCNDDDPCTISTMCRDGVCERRTIEGCCHGDADCDDGEPCTVDRCLSQRCQHEAFVCDDDNDCTDDRCASGRGCVFTPRDGEACGFDRSPCRWWACVGDTCSDTGPAIHCDDSNPCSDDLCLDDGSCEHYANEASCEDGDLCTTDDYCKEKTCRPGPPVVCPDDGFACTEARCDSALGCVHEVVSECCGNDLVEAGELCDPGLRDGEGPCDAACRWRDVSFVAASRIPVASVRAASLSNGRAVVSWVDDGVLWGRVLEGPATFRSEARAIATLGSNNVAWPAIGALGAGRIVVAAARATEDPVVLTLTILDEDLEPLTEQQVPLAAKLTGGESLAVRAALKAGNALITTVAVQRSTNPTAPYSLRVWKHRVSPPAGDETWSWSELHSATVSQSDELIAGLRIAVWHDGTMAIVVRETSPWGDEIVLRLLRAYPPSPDEWTSATVTLPLAVPTAHRSVAPATVTSSGDDALLVYLEASPLPRQDWQITCRRYDRVSGEPTENRTRVATGNGAFAGLFADAAGSGPPLIGWQASLESTPRYRFLQDPFSYTDPGIPVPHGDTLVWEPLGWGAVDWDREREKLLVWVDYRAGGYVRVVVP